MRKFKATFYILFVFVLGIGALFYYMKDAKPVDAEPELSVKAYESATVLAENIGVHLDQKFYGAKHIWLGVEPEKPLFLDIALELKKLYEQKSGAFDKVYLDFELGLKSKNYPELSTAEDTLVKMEWANFAEKLKTELDQRVLVITASIYATPILKHNPINKIKDLSGIDPLTISMAYFPVNLDDEKLSLFPCNTEDQTGAREWACSSLNRSRVQRRKVDPAKLKDSVIFSFMDSTSDQDYMLIAR